ncbi:hypothetical protein [Pseudomonas putida]|nr:hypothetical protein [Pseudomonas putida]
MTTTTLVVDGLVCIVIVALFVCIGFALYLGYTQGERLCGYFKNSSSSITSVTRNSSGPYGKMQLVGGIAFVVAFPGFFLRHGIVNAEDIKNFPLSLKWKLVALQWGFMVVFISMGVLVSIGI